MNLSQMNPVADTANFLVAYPQGLQVDNTFIGFTGPGWNLDGTLSDNDDIDFTYALINQIQEGYAIDTNRIFAVGWSMGGNMSYQLGCTPDSPIASIASVAGQLASVQVEPCNPQRPVSLLSIHGSEDPLAPIEGVDMVLTSGSFTASFWAGLNNCSEDSVVIELEDLNTEDSSTVTLTSYRGCEGNTEVQYYVINGGGHTWPGGGPLIDAFGHINQDINASSVIWNFFNRNPRQNISTDRKEILETLSKGISYFPNPFNGDLSIDLQLITSRSVRFSLSNLVGQTVIGSRPYQLFKGTNRVQWNIAENSLEEGLYFLSVEINGIKSMYPLLYQRI